MLNFKKYKKLKIGLGQSFPLKILEYTRDNLTSKKFNNGPGKKIQFINFINHIYQNASVNVTDSHYEFQKQIANRDIKFRLRKKSSDPYVYNHIIEKEEYAFLTDFLEDHNKEYVFLDIGANVGLTTLYLSAHFPKARIYSFEPEPSNFSCLKNHVEINGSALIRVFNKGLYISDGILYANRSFRDGEHWSFKLDETNAAGNAEQLEVISFDTLLNQCELNEIDFMKIDIEGGELPLLKDPRFLHLIETRVKVMMIEIHPEVIDYNEAKNILKENGFLVFDIGMNSVGLNKKLGLNKYT